MIRHLILKAIARKALPVAALLGGMAISALIDAPNWRAHRDAIRRGEAYTTGGR
jgi:hypothetical protein